MHVHVTPTRQLHRLELFERGESIARRARVILANLPAHIGERECKTLSALTGWPASAIMLESPTNSRGPGNVVLIELESQYVTEVFTGFGEIGVKAERVASDAWNQARRYLATSTPVGEHLADQLMLPLGASVLNGGPGGEYRTVALSRHATTHLEVLREFLDIDIAVDRRDRDDCTVRIGPR
jgi:RNA 3'-terminal phosphate cyclase (ATP)